MLEILGKKKVISHLLYKNGEELENLSKKDAI